MCLNIAQLVMIRANYHNIAQLLLLTIIVSSKNYTVSIIDKENITIYRQKFTLQMFTKNIYHQVFQIIHEN